MNNGVMGSMFTRYKSPALVNLDWTTTFTPELLRKDLDLGLALGRELGVPMPVTAAAREVLQQHFGAAQLKPDPEKYLGQGFRRAARDDGDRRRREAQEREQAGADGAGVGSIPGSPLCGATGMTAFGRHLSHASHRP